MKVIFFGSSSYCLPIAQKLHQQGSLSTIITKPQGKISEFAYKNKIKSFLVRNDSELEEIKDELLKIAPDLAIVSDFGLIIPKDIFPIPKYGTLNIHFSLLPELRGASPVQYTIRQGRKTAGISVFIMDEGLDTGDIIWQKEILLTGQETAESLYKKLFNIISTDLPDIIIQYTSGSLKPQKQDDAMATYTKILTRKDGFIPFESIKSLEVERKIRAFTPWPGVWTEISISDGKKRMKILKAHLESGKTIIDQVQLEGKKPVTWKQFQEGYKITP